MYTSTTEVRRGFEDLAVRAMIARQRAAELMASSETIRSRNIHRRIQSSELRGACREAVLQCRATRKCCAAQGRARTCLSAPEPLEVAQAIARALSELGLSAFVFQPPEDTAIRL